jgi:hypothetical protein
VTGIVIALERHIGAALKLGFCRREFRRSSGSTELLPRDLVFRLAIVDAFGLRFVLHGVFLA